MAEQLAFKVDCGWLCDFVRQRVYWEGVPFTEGVKLLTECVSGLDESLAVQILIGQKKIVGINGGEIVDDDKSDEYMKYIARQEGNKLKKEIEFDILVHPYAYLDPFATRWSVKEFEEQHPNFSTATIKELTDYFGQPPCDTDHLMQGGLYSISSEFIDKPIQSKEDQEEFYRKLYAYWKNYLKEYDKLLDDAAKLQISLRQRTYRLWRSKAARREKRLAKLLAEATTDEEKERAEHTVKRAEGPDWVLSKEGTYTLIKGDELAYQSGGKLVPCDNGVFWRYGLISPKGDFYACTWAGHNQAAYVIYTTILKQKIESDACLTDEWNIAKDRLYDLGWCFVETAWGYAAEGLFYSKWGKVEDMPQRMMDTAYDYIVWRRQQSEDTLASHRLL